MTAQQRITAGEPQPLPLTREHYLLLSEAGAFDAYGKTEFIDGVIYFVNAQHSRHSRVHIVLVRRLSDAIDALAEPMVLGLELTIDHPSGALPQPDLLIAHTLPDDAPAVAAEVRLAIEVTSSTLANDLGRKPTLYASCGVGEYWVVDVDGGCVHQFSNARGDCYESRRVVPFGQPLTAATIPDLTIATDGLT